MNYKVKCNKCGSFNNITVELDYVDTDSSRQMGSEHFYSGISKMVCECGQEIKVEIEGSEYPVGAEIEIHNLNVSGGKLVN